MGKNAMYEKKVCLIATKTDTEQTDIHLHR